MSDRVVTTDGAVEAERGIVVRLLTARIPTFDWSGQTVPALARWRDARLRVPDWRVAAIPSATFAYGLMLACIFGGYYAYLIAWLLKLYYIGWFGALLLGLAMLVAPSRWSLRGLGYALVPVAAWYGYLALTLLWSPDRGTSLTLLLAQGICVMAFLLGYAWHLNVAEWQRSSYFALVMLAWLPQMAWMLAASGQLLDDRLGAVRTGFVSSGLTALPYLVWRARVRPRLRRWFLVALTLGLLLASGSRTAPVLGLFAVLASLGFVQRPGGWRKVGGLLAGLAGVLVIAGISLTIPSVRNAVRFSIEKLARETVTTWVSADELSSSPESARQDFERRLQAAVAIQSFLEHPVRGAGYFSTLSLTRDRYGLEVAAHGLVSLLLGETGLVGLMLFGWLLVRFARNTRIARDRAVDLEQRGFVETARWTMLVLVIFGLFHQVDQAPQFWLLLAWGLGRPADAARDAVSGAVAEG